MRIWRVMHDDDEMGAQTAYFTTYPAAVKSLVDGGFEIRREADPDKGVTAMACRNSGMFGVELCHIGWIDVTE